ncbi:cupin domain-containing protein [Sphingomonas adhaesiva]|uniref:cupin domain-containing protein n=1 Tax=Sphingomonas adhaesiva TaxID=28212 RepID=UPI002FF804C0
MEKVRDAAAMPAFVHDLRAFAADPAAGEATRETGDAWFAARRVLPYDGPVAVSVMTLEGSGEVTLGFDEFVFVIAGTLTIAADTTREIAADTGAMLPQGLAFGWTAAAGTQAAVVRYLGAGGGADHVVPIDLGATLNPSNPPAADVLTSDVPSCRSHTDYVTPNGEFMCGVWDSTPYARRAIDYRHAELMHLLAGSVTFEDDHGNAATFRRGDLFVMLPGARCSWLSTEDCAKLWVIYRAAA